MLWKILLGYGILKSCSPHGYSNFENMATRFNRAIDLQIRNAQMAALENIQSYTGCNLFEIKINVTLKHFKQNSLKFSEYKGHHIFIQEKVLENMCDIHIQNFCWKLCLLVPSNYVCDAVYHIKVI